MADLISLQYFHAQTRQYHLYQPSNSEVSEIPHYHDYYQVCFVLRGEIIHRQENHVIRLCRGDAFVIPPGFVHSVIFADKNAKIYSLSFSYFLFHSELSQSAIVRFLVSLNEAVFEKDSHFIRMRIALNGNQQRNVQALLECLLFEQIADNPPEFSAATSIIAAILYTLSQSYYYQPENDALRKEITFYGKSLSKCTIYINQHYADAITLNDLCRRFGLSRSKFCMLFPQFTGVSFKQYIRNKRILEAQTRIRLHPEETFVQIAQAVGYSDSSTFYRNFKQVVGISPTQYKNTIEKSCKKLRFKKSGAASDHWLL